MLSWAKLEVPMLTFLKFARQMRLKEGFLRLVDSLKITPDILETHAVNIDQSQSSARNSLPLCYQETLLLSESHPATQKPPYLGARTPRRSDCKMLQN